MSEESVVSDASSFGCQLLSSALATMSSISLIRKGPGAVLHTSAMVMAILRMAASCKHRQNAEYGPPASTFTDGLARFSVIIVPLMMQILLISQCYCQLSISSRILFAIVLLDRTSFASIIMWFGIIYHVAVQTLASKQPKSVLQHAHSADKALAAVCIRCLAPDLFPIQFCAKLFSRWLAKSHSQSTFLMATHFWLLLLLLSVAVILYISVNVSGLLAIASVVELPSFLLWVINMRRHLLSHP